MAIRLTEAQRALLTDLDDCLGGMSVGEKGGHSMAVARSLEKRGFISIEVGHYGYRTAFFDDEFRADWARDQESIELEEVA